MAVMLLDLIRTVRLKLLVSPAQAEAEAEALQTTLVANREALNYTSRVAFEKGGISAFKRLQQVVYRDLRDKFGLKSQMACN